MGIHARTRTPAALAATAAALAAAVAWPLLSTASAQAAGIWDGDASKGTNVFGNVECPAPGSLITAASGTPHGTVFRYTKPGGDIRCESRGVSVNGSSRYAFAAGSTYYLGWESQLSSVSGDFVVWQWKSYPNAQQNYPLIMTIKDGSARLFHVTTGGDWQMLWSEPVTAGDWNAFAVGIRTSGTASSGWVELYFNGTKQTLADGSTRYACRTWDSANEPKWGVYDRDDGSTTLINRVDSLKMGTSYADVT
ncbi:heparin lyase I family protein [Streptomyces atroolivaceus]|uniref:heparin lyase I family protein n=1 Tax=Streptomyces atroolivaceus TaxID=66869 RepID=UPI00363CDAB1